MPRYTIYSPRNNLPPYFRSSIENERTQFRHKKTSCSIRESRIDMLLKPQDIVILLKLSAIANEWTYSSLARELSMSPTEVRAGIKRTVHRLFDAQGGCRSIAPYGSSLRTGSGIHSPLIAEPSPGGFLPGTWRHK